MTPSLKRLYGIKKEVNRPQGVGKLREERIHSLAEKTPSQSLHTQGEGSHVADQKGFKKSKIFFKTLARH